ncbi:MAG: isocitrate dehydrogenase (NAD(+)) [Planctomycetes bacterium]|nr:isocitrate dehydrogenase (NAD(+)) [Planctomycetota bacterium]
MTQIVTLIPGDGIGPEIAAATVQVFEALDCGIEFENADAGASAHERTGELIPRKTHASIRRNKIALKGPLTTPVGTGHKSVNVQLRQQYELFANIRPIKLIPGVQSRYVGEHMDMVLFRENTEDLYAGKEHEIVPGVVETLKIITAKASNRIARAAFEYARRRGRKKVTAVHKANIMKLSDGLFLDCARRTAKRFPDIAFEDLIVDNCCMQIVINPSRFDVIVLPNLYGDIISDLCAGLVGGLGVVPGANIGKSVAIFESVHGSAPDIAGRGIANPTALILSGSMMLRHLGLDDAAFLLRNAISTVIEKGECKTPDLGGDASTTEFTSALVREVTRRRRRKSTSVGRPVAKKAKRSAARKSPAKSASRRKSPR